MPFIIHRSSFPMLRPAPRSWRAFHGLQAGDFFWNRVALEMRIEAQLE
jgi:hypothetical protein